MKYNDVYKRVLNWDAADFGKTNRDIRFYLLGMASGAEMTMGEYEGLVKFINHRRTKKHIEWCKKEVEMMEARS